MKIKVKFILSDYNRWMKAVERLKNAARSEKENLPRMMSIDYIDMIRKNISSGRYSSTYPRYNQRYQEWKYQIFKSSGGFWHLRGELMASLSSRKMKGGWFGGIPSDAYDSGNVSWFGKGDKGRKMQIAQYAIWMEYGRTGQPSRPLFRPTLIEYSEGKAKATAKKSHTTIGRQWR